jgi:ATP-dependent DNA helicase RecG
VTRGSVFIGTHALLEAAVEIPRLGLVIIDEQHKFGVTQREKLVRKGWYPHLLVMTATPIPRTLGLTVYGDLDVSVIEELPRGRPEIETFVRDTSKLPQIWKFVKQQLEKGRQAYVVYSRVDKSNDEGDLKSVKREAANLQIQLAPFAVGLLHGSLPAEIKEQTMSLFRSGKIQVLVASSVIEVGIDIPNANVMVIENAERFGMAQLHQLRGRIGRGSHKSFCILVADPKSEESTARLKILEKTRDGFEVAEQDLKLRGAGNLLGSEQSGASPLIFADLAHDYSILQKARTLAAEQIIQN